MNHELSAATIDPGSPGTIFVCQVDHYSCCARQRCGVLHVVSPSCLVASLVTVKVTGDTHIMIRLCWSDIRQDREYRDPAGRAEPRTNLQCTLCPVSLSRHARYNRPLVRTHSIKHGTQIDLGSIDMLFHCWWWVLYDCRYNGPGYASSASRHDCAVIDSRSRAQNMTDGVQRIPGLPGVRIFVPIFGTKEAFPGCDDLAAVVLWGFNLQHEESISIQCWTVKPPITLTPPLITPGNPGKVHTSMSHM